MIRFSFFEKLNEYGLRLQKEILCHCAMAYTNGWTRLPKEIESYYSIMRKNGSSYYYRNTNGGL